MNKHLGQWLKSALDSTVEDTAVEAVKLAHIPRLGGLSIQFMMANVYPKHWLFYGGVNDTDPPTCFVANNPLCSVCELA